MDTTSRTNPHDRSSPASRPQRQGSDSRWKERLHPPSLKSSTPKPSASAARPAAMVTVAGRAFRLRGCRRCGGDCYLDQTDEPEWRCLQCARVVPTGAAAAPVGNLARSEDAA